MGTTEGATPHDAPGDDRLGRQGMPQPRADAALVRARVVQAVVDLAMGGGYSAVTWEAVAARSGLGLVEVQQHGATLDDLLLMTLETCLQSWISTSPTWTRVGPPGVPFADMPFNVIRIDPRNTRTVYAGSDNGLWKSSDGGATFAKVGRESGLPPASIYDIQINPTTGRTMLFTYGRGAFVSTR